MDAGSEGPPDHFSQVKIVCHREMLQSVGSVLEWCLKHGRMCDHPADFAAKVAHIIDLGVKGDHNLPAAETLRDVPGASVGSWWIADVAIDGDDLEIYKFLADHAKKFRENVWTEERQLRRAKYVLEMVEAEMKIYRIKRCFAQMDMELVPVGHHAQQEAPAVSDMAAEYVWSQKMRLGHPSTRSTNSSVEVPPAVVNEPTAVEGDTAELWKNVS